MSAEVFKAYDIRGRLNEQEINPALLQRIGRAFADWVPESTVIVGRDIRPSSQSLAKAFQAGVRQQDKHVLDLGLATTDMVHYAAVHHELPAAMITASHNPPDYNGLKLCLNQAQSLTSAELQRLKHNLPSEVTGQGQGGYQKLKFTEIYLEHLLGTVIETQAIRPLTVGVDGGNGMAGLLVPQLFDQLPSRLEGLFLTPDGRFPNHLADPSKAENLRDLQQLVRDRQCDFGVAFDGDADRAVFVDKQGAVISGGQLLIIIARWLLPKTSPDDNTIVYDSIASQAVPEALVAAGGQPIRSRVGTPFVKQTMAEVGAIFGAETSGHCYFRANSSIDSGLLTMLAVMQCLSETNRSLQQLSFNKFDIYHHLGEFIFQCPNQPQMIIEAVKNNCALLPNAKVDDFDGLEIRWPDVWFNLRASNTEPIIRLNVEGLKHQRVNQLATELQAFIKQKIAAQTQSSKMN